MLFNRDETQRGGVEFRVSDLPITGSFIWVMRSGHPPVKVELANVKPGDVVEVYPPKNGIDQGLGYCSPTMGFPTIDAIRVDEDLNIGMAVHTY